MQLRVAILSFALGGLAVAGACAASGAHAASGAGMPADLVPAMVAVDRAYIPALALSGQPDQAAKARAALATFDAAWSGFKNGVGGQPGFDEEWRHDVDRVDGAIEKAKQALSVDGKAAVAHEALESVRMTLLNARQREKVPYFLDYVTLYHNSMEDVLNGKPEGAIADWSAAERLSFVSDLDMAAARWNKVKAMEALLPAAGLPPGKLAKYDSQWSLVASIMKDSRGALDAGDDAALARNLGRLKPEFTKTFFLFGDFPQ